MDVTAVGAVGGVAVDFDRFLTEQHDGLLRFATVLCGDRGQAEDVTQEVLLRAYQRWDRVTAADSPLAYVRTMLVNEHLSWRRKWRRIVPVAEPRARQSRPDVGPGIDDRDQLRRLLVGQYAPNAWALAVSTTDPLSTLARPLSAAAAFALERRMAAAVRIGDRSAVPAAFRLTALPDGLIRDTVAFIDPSQQDSGETSFQLALSRSAGQTVPDVSIFYTGFADEPQDPSRYSTGPHTTLRTVNGLVWEFSTYEDGSHHVRLFTENGLLELSGRPGVTDSDMLALMKALQLAPSWKRTTWFDGDTVTP